MGVDGIQPEAHRRDSDVRATRSTPRFDLRRNIVDALAQRYVTQRQHVFRTSFVCTSRGVRVLASAAADAECRIGTRPPSSGLTGAKSGSVSRTRVLKSDNVALSVLSVAGWHLEAMTSQEPGTAAEPTTTAGDHDTAVDSTPPSRRQSWWSKLNRTNRIAAFVLGGVASVFVAALIFGAGVLVGAEFGDSEGHHRGSETADYGAGGGDGSGEHEGSGSEGNGDRGGDSGSEGNRDRGESDQQPRPEAPASSAPATPRP